MDTSVNTSVDLNTTSGNMVKSELEKENVQFKEQVKSLMKKCEEYEQTIYETKRQLSHSKLMEQELTSELEYLQSEKNAQTESLQKIKSLEEENVHLKSINDEIEQKYRDELKEKEGEIEKILSEKLLTSEKEDNEKNNDIIDLKDKIYELKNAIEDLEAEKEELWMKNEEFQKGNTILENKVSVSPIVLFICDGINICLFYIGVI